MIYPRYCSGVGYVVSSDVIRKMMLSLDGVPLFRVDDAYVGELALLSGVDIHRFYGTDDLKNTADCVYHPSFVIYNDVREVSCMDKLYRMSLKFSIT